MMRPKLVIDQRFLVQRHADAPHHAAHDLAARGLGVQDAPGRDRADDAGDADDAELLVDLHLGEDRRMRVVRVRRRPGEVGGLLLLDAVHAAVPHRVRDRHRARGILLADELAVGERDVVGRRASASGEFGIFLRQPQQLLADRVGRSSRSPFDTEAAIHDPPSTGDCGSVESPSLMLTFSSGSPSMSAATCAMIV